MKLPRPTVMLISDLDDDPNNLPALTAVGAVARHDRVPIRIVGLSPHLLAGQAHGAVAEAPHLEVAEADGGGSVGIAFRASGFVHAEHCAAAARAPQFQARLAALKPTILARMHGSAWHGDCAKLLLALAATLDQGDS